MRKLAAAAALCGALLTGAPAGAAEDLASLQEQLQVTNETIQHVEDKWAKLSQELADPNVMVTPNRFEKIRVDQVKAMADMAMKLAQEHPNVVSALQQAYPNEFKMATDFGINIADFANPFTAFIAQGLLEKLVISQLPQVKKDYIAHLTKEHGKVRAWLEARKAETTAKIAALQGAGQSGGTADAGGTEGQTGPADGTGAASSGDGADSGSSTDGTDVGDLPPVTGEAVTAGGDQPTGPKPVAGSTPFDTAALENQGWPGTWEAECKDGGGGNLEKKSGPAEFRFAGRTAQIIIKGDGDPMPLPVELDAMGAFAMRQADQGSEFAASGQFQNYDYGDDTYAPNGRGTFRFALDLSFIADMVAGAFTLGAADGAELTPEQREANTLRCNGTWELPLPG